MVDLEDIDVAHGIGFISDQRDWFSRPSPLEEVSPYLQAIEDGEPLALDLSLSHRLLQSLRGNPSALTHTAVRRFLRADEAVVRASAARIWCRVPRDSDDDILARLEADAVPSVSIGVLRELARHWDDLEDARRERILNILVQHARSPGCASVLLSRLVLFNRVEHFGERPPWRIFTELTPVVLRNLPLSVDFRDGRLNAALDDALAQAPTGTLSPLIEAWASRILRRLDGRQFLDDFELAIVEPLLAGVEADTRFPILRDLLNVTDTGARVVTTRRLAADWNELSPVEHALVRDVLAEDRPDARWLAASVLTLTDPPKELVVTLTGDADALELNPGELEHSLGSEVFTACVRMYVGRPQPLWWYGTHHSASQTWAAVVRYLARTPSHPLHAIGFYEIAAFGKMGELAGVIDGLPEDQLPDTLECLLNFKLTRTGDWRPDAWRRLLARADAAGLLNAFMARIDLELDGVLEELGDIKYWLGDKTLERRVFGLLPNDARAIVSASNLLEAHQVAKQNATTISADEETLKTLFAELCTREMLDLEVKPPRIFGTWRKVADIFKTVGAKSETLELLEAGRLEALERHRARCKRRDEELSPVELEGWVDQAKLGD